jgi:phosphoribosyl 1,2-cyclic phosphate phosphodiesterase
LFLKKPLIVNREEISSVDIAAFFVHHMHISGFYRKTEGRFAMISQLTFLGVGDAMGVPRVYCECEVCMEARAYGRNLRRRSSVFIEGDHGNFMIDCGPDWTHQMEILGLRFVDNIMITHAHHDHVAGLPAWTDACRWLQREGNLYARPDILEIIHKQYPWLGSHLRFHPLQEEGPSEFMGWTLRSWKVNHGKNGYSYAFRFDRENYRWVYCPDSIGLNEGEQKLFLDVNLLILGTSYYHEEAPYHSRSVYDMIEALEVVAKQRPKAVFFTHMSHGVDTRENYPLPAHVKLASEGMVIAL